MKGRSEKEVKGRSEVGLPKSERAIQSPVGKVNVRLRIAFDHIVSAAMGFAYGRSLALMLFVMAVVEAID